MGSLALLRSRNNFAVFGSLYPHHYYAQRAKKFTNYYASEGTKFFRVSWYQLVLAKSYPNEQTVNNGANNDHTFLRGYS